MFVRPTPTASPLAQAPPARSPATLATSNLEPNVYPTALPSAAPLPTHALLPSVMDRLPAPMAPVLSRVWVRNAISLT